MPAGPGLHRRRIKGSRGRFVFLSGRAFSRGGLDAVTAIIALNFAVLLVQQLSPGWLDSDAFQIWLTQTFGLSLDGLSQGRFWQFVTHLFVHGGSQSPLTRLMHFAMNMALIYAAGKALIPEIGNLAVAALYLVSGIAGGLLQILLIPDSLLVGASGAAFGLVLAYTTLCPAEDLYAWVLFFPVSLRSHTLGRALLWTNLFFTATAQLAQMFQWTLPLAGGIAHAAHTGGSLAGWLIARCILLPRRFPKFTRESLKAARVHNDQRLAQNRGSSADS
ncbi:MAG TPA: rhomboid family intramembrane serine protease [Verrucomicrobiales bacterium]|nr:rhomboid family intramembrane serine protease [Verrucomicrobiales bacterium]